MFIIVYREIGTHTKVSCMNMFGDQAEYISEYLRPSNIFSARRQAIHHAQRLEFAHFTYRVRTQTSGSYNQHPAAGRLELRDRISSSDRLMHHAMDILLPFTSFTDCISAYRVIIPGNPIHKHCLGQDAGCMN